mmetsp:Transcript_159820/g.512854  ORF Transcript_159820/g.512854 Transcript_159820/m.512854 type:complete len:200 (-) Transcript_159820:22-621(-)
MPSQGMCGNSSCENEAAFSLVISLKAFHCCNFCVRIALVNSEAWCEADAACCPTNSCMLCHCKLLIARSHAAPAMQMVAAAKTDSRLIFPSRTAPFSGPEERSRTLASLAEGAMMAVSVARSHTMWSLGSAEANPSKAPERTILGITVTGSTLMWLPGSAETCAKKAAKARILVQDGAAMACKVGGNQRYTCTKSSTAS